MTFSQSCQSSLTLPVSLMLHNHSSIPLGPSDAFHCSFLIIVLAEMDTNLEQICLKLPPLCKCSHILRPRKDVMPLKLSIFIAVQIIFGRFRGTEKDLHPLHVPRGLTTSMFAKAREDVQSS